MASIPKEKRRLVVIITILMTCFQPVFWYHVARFFNAIYGFKSAEKSAEGWTNADIVCILSCLLFMAGIVIGAVYYIHGSLNSDNWEDD